MKNSRESLRFLLLASALAGALLFETAQPASAAVLVRAKCNFFKPARVKVAKGTKVVWKSKCRSHTVTAYSSNWSKDVVLHLGDTTAKRFKHRGVFLYRCRFHSTLVAGVCSGMCGRVRVT